MMAKAPVKTIDAPPNDDEQRERWLADMLVHPLGRHSTLLRNFGPVATTGEAADGLSCAEVISDDLVKARGGDLSFASDILAAQAITLDYLFTELTLRAGRNIGEYPDAVDRYLRLALKAQANSRATLEALAKLHQPREQTVRHVHVNEGGQAVIADEFHHHAGGQQNAGPAEQPHEPHRSSGSRAALPRPDPFGNGVPVPGNERTEPVQAARGKKPRRTEG